MHGRCADRDCQRCVEDTFADPIVDSIASTFNVESPTKTPQTGTPDSQEVAIAKWLGIGVGGTVVIGAMMFVVLKRIRIHQVEKVLDVEEQELDEAMEILENKKHTPLNNVEMVTTNPLFGASDP